MKQGWQIKNIGDISRIVNGGTPKTSIEAYWGGEHLWITPKDMGKLKSNYVESTGRTITEDGLNNSSAKLLPTNSIILSSRAPIGHLAINTKPISTNQGCKGMIPSNEIDTMYLFYFLRNSVKLLNDLGSGTTFKELSGTKLSSVPIPIPPLDEQKRIVAKLDELFALIENGKLKVENLLADAKELFQSQLNEVFETGKLKVESGKWVEKKLGEVAFVKSGGTPLRSNIDYWENGQIPWYSSGELNNLYTDNPKRCITQNGLENSNAKLFPKGSLLIGMYDTAALKMSIIDRDATFNQAIAGVKPTVGLNLQFVLHSINAIKHDLLKQRRGVRQKNLSLGKIINILIPLPSIEIQEKVVEELNLFRLNTQTLESKYQQELDALDELKKSILQKAFNGEL